MYLDGYASIMGIVDNIAKTNRSATPSEIRDLERIANQFDILIEDVADNNGCNDCYTWDDLVNAIKELHNQGKTVKLSM